MQKPWFPAKRYGWGWGLPATWQGWVVLAVFVAFLTWNSIEISSARRSAPDLVPEFLARTFIATIIFILIAYRTGEKPKWRWGDKR
jgi:hypothetical protein